MARCGAEQRGLSEEEGGGGFGGDGERGSLGRAGSSASEGGVGRGAAARVDLINGGRGNDPSAPGARNFPGWVRTRAQREEKQPCVVWSDVSNRGTKPVVGSGGRGWRQRPRLAAGLGLWRHRWAAFLSVAAGGAAGGRSPCQ